MVPDWTATIYWFGILHRVETLSRGASVIRRQTIKEAIFVLLYLKTVIERDT